MALYTLYGINCVGKDTVATELVARHDDLIVTSESRLLMYILGITTSFRRDAPLTRDQYRELENTPQETMVEIESTKYREIVVDLAQRKEKSLILSHLVFALFVDKEIQYLDARVTPQWYLDANNGIAQLIAPAAVIFQRRRKDAIARDRGEFTVEDIERHQALCDTKWENIVAAAREQTVTSIIDNIDLMHATSRVEDVFFV